jgi:small subunit ribosomal protein S8
MTDPIADMLNRIKNAQALLKERVSLPFSNLKYNIALILKREGFIEDVKKRERKRRKMIEISLKYYQENSNKIPAISGLRRISKPGQRLYIKSKKIRKVKGGYGILIISTPKGLMTDKEAKKENLGGEMICEVW